MKISSRELGLAWVTTMVLILAGTYWFGQPKAKAWKMAAKERESIAWKMKEIDHLLSDQTNVNQRLDVLAKGASFAPAGQGRHGRASDDARADGAAARADPPAARTGEGEER